MRPSIWQDIVKQGSRDLLREMVFSIKAAEADALLNDETKAIDYILKKADILDILVYLEIDEAQAILFKDGEKVLEGELLEIALYLQEQPVTSGYSLTVTSLTQAA